VVLLFDGFCILCYLLLSAYSEEYDQEDLEAELICALVGGFDVIVVLLVLWEVRGVVRGGYIHNRPALAVLVFCASG
jgi:hypothetical protein